MTTRLTDRLERLERSRMREGGSASVPREVMGAWLRAVAVALGGYPRPRDAGAPYSSDSLSDGFARGLGFADRTEMVSGMEADPEGFQDRMGRASEALCERYRAEGRPDQGDDAFRVLCFALDEVAAAQAGSADWSDDDTALLQAMAHYGVEAQAR
ncbi:hypothetical protein FF100_34300 [Methylobacterium terricola]|uniref:Uncharacterized protein n=1 Tax=Methylobacterium terricola TaxID=2583531 RepID=A0A5C4L6P4_9HYPH|nr:hypothetical protein [Methylobacterium terricola]TNC06523.1 hypothetical protein FF100_34300 [Methylobacterium terricola]